MRYTSWKFLYPPRPENAIMSSSLSFYEDQGWVGQIKKNGTGSVIGIGPDKQTYSKTRHGEEHKMWELHPDVEIVFNRLPKQWFVFVYELLHNKTPHIKDTIYIHDILVSNSFSLEDTKFLDRQAVLLDLFKPEVEATDHYKVNEKVWIAKNFTQGFKEIFDSLEQDEDEGLVLKNPESLLAPCSRATSNTVWQVKCRKGTKNYGF